MLSLSFVVTRKAKIQLVAKRKGKTVAKTRNTTFKKGRHTLKLSCRASAGRRRCAS